MIKSEFIDRRPTEADIAREARRKRCLRHPDKVLSVGLRWDAAGNFSHYAVHCPECYPGEPVLGERPSRILERSEKLISTALATRQERQERLATLDLNEVRILLSLGKATSDEVRQFVLYCRAVDADPWAKEIYLIKYDEKHPAAIVLALNWYLKRASHNALYESYASGVIVLRGEDYVDVVGSVVYPSDKLFGGWCKVYKKGASHPFERRVTLKEYQRWVGNVPMAQWRDKPATMIEKVAIVQGIRRAFPDEFGPLDEAEAQQAMPIVLEGEVEEMSVHAPLVGAIEQAKESIGPMLDEMPQPPQETPQDASKGPPAPSDMTADEAPPTPNFEQRKKAMFDEAKARYGLEPIQVANAVGLSSVDEITEKSDLRYIFNEIGKLGYTRIDEGF